MINSNKSHLSYEKGDHLILIITKVSRELLMSVGQSLADDIFTSVYLSTLLLYITYDEIHCMI